MMRNLDPQAILLDLASKDFHRSFRAQCFTTSLPILAVDIVTFTICFSLASWMASCMGVVSNSADNYFVFGILGAALASSFGVLGLYRSGGMNRIYEMRQCSIGIVLCFLLVYCAQVQTKSSFSILMALPLALVLVPTVRAIFKPLFSKFDWWGVRCLIFDGGDRIESLYQNHLQNIPNGFRPVGFLQPEMPAECDPNLRSRYCGPLENAIRISIAKRAYCAIVHRHGRSDNQICNMIETHLRSFSRIIIVPDDVRLPSLWSMGGSGGISFEDKLLNPSSQFMKRIFDLALSVIVLFALAPLMLCLMAWIRFTSKGPIFFGHIRIGKHGQSFRAWKFRSMVENANEVLEHHLAENPELKAEWEATQKLKRDPRVTPPGRLLRKTSLDELPQLWNIIKGEMSFVGPRPIVENEVEKYRETFQSYLRVTPGLTGFWQVSGRNLTSYEKRVGLDDYYVRNWSIWFDMYILARTVKTVFMREGAF